MYGRKNREADADGNITAPLPQSSSIVEQSFFSKRNTSTQSPPQSTEEDRLKISLSEHKGIEPCFRVPPRNHQGIDVFYKNLIAQSHHAHQSFDSIRRLFMDNLSRGTVFYFKYPLQDALHARTFSKVLKIKAEEAHRFVPMIGKSEYISKANHGFIRKIQIHDGPTVQEHVLTDPKSNTIIFVEEWEEMDNQRTEGRFAALNTIMEDKGKWYFIGIYLYHDQPLPRQIEDRKEMFKKTYENMLLFSKNHNVEYIYQHLQSLPQEETRKSYSLVSKL